METYSQQNKNIFQNKYYLRTENSNFSTVEEITNKAKIKEFFFYHSLYFHFTIIKNENDRFHTV